MRSLCVPHALNRYTGSNRDGQTHREELEHVWGHFIRQRRTASTPGTVQPAGSGRLAVPEPQGPGQPHLECSLGRDEENRLPRTFEWQASHRLCAQAVVPSETHVGVDTAVPGVPDSPNCPKSNHALRQACDLKAIWTRSVCAGWYTGSIEG